MESEKNSEDALREIATNLRSYCRQRHEASLGLRVGLPWAPQVSVRVSYLRLGTLLAASPQSSIRFGLDLARTARTRVNGTAVAGTETFSGVVELGLVSLFNKTTSLDVNVGFGITPDAPRMRLGVVIPMRLR